MTRSGIVNTVGFGGLQVLNLKQAAKAAGWTVPRSSDGITYNPTGDILTQAGAPNGTPGNISNARAWFVLRDPAGNRSVCIQRGGGTTSTASDHQWRVKIAVNFNDFIGGSPGPTQTPSAAFEQALVGSAADSPPIIQDWFQANTPYVVGHAVFDNQAVGGVYPMHFYCVRCCTGVVGASLLIEPMQVGTYAPADQDPAVYFRTLDGISISNTSASFWYGFGTPSQVWRAATNLNVPANFAPGFEPQNLYGDTLMAQHVYNDTVTNPTKKKGQGAFIRVRGDARVYPALYHKDVDPHVSWASGLCLPFLKDINPLI